MRENTRSPGAPPDPASVLFNAYHRRILELLLPRPMQSLHVRAIARATGIPVGSLHRELKLLAGAGLLRRTRIGNQVHYQVDPACPIHDSLSTLFEKLVPPRAHVAETPATYAAQPVRRPVSQSALERLDISSNALASLCRRHHVRKLSFFGSVTREDFRPDSDVDVLVEFSARHSATLTDLVELRDALSRLFGGRRVDVATPAVMSNPYRRQTIERDLQIAYAGG